jgi:hypothetical protein
MRIPYQFRDVVLAALLLSCLAKAAPAQQSPQQLDVPTLSPAVHSALYPEVMCDHCIIPQWDHGYILHREFDKDPAVVTMYDRDGKKVLEARMEPPDAAKVSLSAAASTHAGGILAVGGGVMTDGITAIRPTRIRTSYATIVLRRACSKVSFPSIPFPNHGTQL